MSEPVHNERYESDSVAAHTCPSSSSSLSHVRASQRLRHNGTRIHLGTLFGGGAAATADHETTLGERKDSIRFAVRIVYANAPTVLQSIQSKLSLALSLPLSLTHSVPFANTALI